MGCSNSHPHGQVWSLSEVPSIPSKELDSLRRYSRQVPASPKVPCGPQGWLTAAHFMILDFMHCDQAALAYCANTLMPRSIWNIRVAVSSCRTNTGWHLCLGGLFGLSKFFVRVLDPVVPGASADQIPSFAFPQTHRIY